MEGKKKKGGERVRERERIGGKERERKGAREREKEKGGERDREVLSGGQKLHFHASVMNVSGDP